MAISVDVIASSGRVGGTGRIVLAPLPHLALQLTVPMLVEVH